MFSTVSRGKCKRTRFKKTLISVLFLIIFFRPDVSSNFLQRLLSGRQKLSQADKELTLKNNLPCSAVVSSQTADPAMAVLIPAGSHTFIEIDNEIISIVIHLPFADSRRVVVSYKYVREVLVNRLVKLAQKICV